MGRQQVNYRLPKLTRDQIKWIADTQGLTETQIIILAVDRLHKTLRDSPSDIQGSDDASNMQG